MGTLTVGANSFSVSNDLLSSTLYDIRDQAVDNLFQKTAFLDHAKRAGGVVKKNGGEIWIEPLAVAEHSNITQLTTGFETVDMSVSDVLQPASYRWCKFAAPISISRDEELSNRGPLAMANILQSRMDSVMGLLKREIESQIVADTSTVLTNLNSLYGGYSGNAVNDGFLYADTAGTAGTVGGLARSVATGLQNQVVDDNASASIIDSLTDAYMKAQHYALNGQTDVLLAGEGAFKQYKKELFANERYIDVSKLDGGRLVLEFNGVPFEWSKWMTSAKNTGSSSTLDKAIFGINFAGIKVAIDSEADFKVLPFRDMTDQLARTAFVHLRLQLFASHLASQFVVLDAAGT